MNGTTLPAALIIDLIRTAIRPAGRTAGATLFAAALGACVTVLVGAAQSRRDAFPPTLVLVSFDGWRWDYHTRYDTPNVRRLIEHGVRAEHLIPSFPSKTFPNHYTVVTGLYPGHHGIVGNTIRDLPTGRQFSLSRRREMRDPMWWGGEPLWVRLQNTGRAAAAMFWPGSEAPIRGQQPRFWAPFDESVSGNARVDQLLRYLDLPDADRPALLMVYFEDVDTIAHTSGPESSAVGNAVRRVDGYLGRLLAGLQRRGLAEAVNIVVTSDHGLAATSNDRVVVLDDYISLDDVEIVDLSPLLTVYPRAGRAEAVYRALASAHPRLRVYRREETPERWQYRDHPRIAPIIGVVDEGWQIMRRGTLIERLARRVATRGEHGYDPEAASMHGIFVAAGPAFKRGITVPPFENVHIYNALALALRIEPAPNDGDVAIARSLLREEGKFTAGECRSPDALRHFREPHFPPCGPRAIGSPAGAGNGGPAGRSVQSSAWNLSRLTLFGVWSSVRLPHATPVDSRRLLQPWRSSPASRRITAQRITTSAGRSRLPVVSRNGGGPIRIPGSFSPSTGQAGVRSGAEKGHR